MMKKRAENMEILCARVLKKIEDHLASTQCEIDGIAIAEFERSYRLSQFYRFIDTLNLIPKSSRKLKVLDVGIGQGHLALLVKSLLAYEVAGIDTERPDKEYMQNFFKKENIEFKMCCLTKDKIPFPDETFDLVLFCEVLEHLPIHPKIVLNEIRRVLKPKGILILTTPNFARISHRIFLALGKNPQDFYFSKSNFRRHYREYTLTECEKLLKESTFKITKIHMSNYRFRTSKRNLKVYILIGISRLLPSLKGCIMIKAQKV